MKTFYFALLLTFSSTAQQKDTLFDIHRFKTGKVSTKATIFNEDIRWGYAKAFDQTGKEIYSMGIRRIGGHASVEFRYFESGAVSSAHYTSQPDGGIQRGDVKHTFNEDGTIASVLDMSTYDQGHMKLFTVQTSPEEKTPEPEKEQEKVEKVQPAYTSQVFLVNLTHRKINVEGVAEIEKATMNAGDTLLGGETKTIQPIYHPNVLLNFTISENFRSKRKQRKNRIQQVWAEPILKSETHRVYYLLLI